jgi:hypothetical protein
MKKLLVLLLVFGLASTANAAIISLSVNASTASDGTEDIDITVSPTITLSVISDTDDHPWLMEVSGPSAASSCAAPVPTANAGGMAAFVDYTGGGLWDYELSTAGAPGSVLAGVQWNMQLTALGVIGDVFTVNLGPYGGTPVSSIEFTLTPEPMTIALLGLGSLFLLRRRK